MFDCSRKPMIMIMAASILLLGSTLYAGPIVINNGSFETGPATSGYIPVNGSDIAGWTITGTIDYIDKALWAAPDGNRSLDLNGTAPGSIAQSRRITPPRSETGERLAVAEL